MRNSIVGIFISSISHSSIHQLYLLRYVSIHSTIQEVRNAEKILFFSFISLFRYFCLLLLYYFPQLLRFINRLSNINISIVRDTYIHCIDLYNIILIQIQIHNLRQTTTRTSSVEILERNCCCIYCGGVLLQKSFTSFHKKKKNRYGLENMYEICMDFL